MVRGGRLRVVRMEEVHPMDFEGDVAGKGVGVCELENLNIVRTLFATIIECSTFLSSKSLLHADMYR